MSPCGIRLTRQSGQRPSTTVDIALSASLTCLTGPGAARLSRYAEGVRLAPFGSHFDCVSVAKLSPPHAVVRSS